MVMDILEEREKRWLFFCERRYFFFFLTAKESRINTDEPYLCVCVCVSLQDKG